MYTRIHSDEGLSTVVKDRPSIFLAGPSPRGYGEGFPPDWRDEAFTLFEEIGYEGRLFIPRPTTGNSSDYDGQIEWELHHLAMADCIMFWVPRRAPDMMGVTTNCEFGLTVKQGRIVYGRPDDALQVRYLDFLYKKFKNKEPLRSLRDTIEHAIEMANSHLDRSKSQQM